MSNDYTVTREDGLVIIAPLLFRPRNGVGRHALPVVGGFIEIDMSDPARGLRAELADVEAASVWLPFVYGDAVTDRALRLEDEQGAAGGQERGGSALSLEIPAMRLLYGFWLRRWKPAGTVPLQEWLLDAELGALAVAAAALFDGEEVAAALLAPHLETLAAQLLAHARVQDRLHPERGLTVSLAADPVSAVVLQAADAALQCVDPAAEGYSAIFDAVEQVTATNAGALDSALETFMAKGDIRLTPMLFNAFRLPGGTTAPSPVHADDAERAPVDWISVHPRQLSAAEAAIHWHREAGDDGTDRVVVIADAPRSSVSMPVEPGELYARLDIDGDITAAVFERRDNDTLVAIAQAARSSSVQVTVYSDIWGEGGRRGPDAEQIAAVRAGVLRLVADRDGSVRDGTARTAGMAPFAAELQLLRDARRS